MLANGLQSDGVVRALEDLCDVWLGGSFLRIEYCLDTQGFWLEPHTDIGAKLFTMLIYLSDEAGSEAWGTDLLDGPDHLVGTTPYQRNCGFIFIPAADTWHGFHRRPIAGCAAVVDRELREAGMACPAGVGVSKAAGAVGGGGVVSVHAGWGWVSGLCLCAGTICADGARCSWRSLTGRQARATEGHGAKRPDRRPWVVRAYVALRRRHTAGLGRAMGGIRGSVAPGLSLG